MRRNGDELKICHLASCCEVLMMIKDRAKKWDFVHFCCARMFQCSTFAHGIFFGHLIIIYLRI